MCTCAVPLCSTYALAIAQLLDPTGQLFQGRIIAQGAEDGAMTTTTKRLMQVSPPGPAKYLEGSANGLPISHGMRYDALCCLNC